MKAEFDIVIIGGGFSAMVIATKIARSKKNLAVAIIEKNDRLGKKISATGNGRGNISNEELSINNYHGKNSIFVKYAIEKYNNKELINYFSYSGLLFSSEKGRIYPSSFQANSITDGLRAEINNYNIKIYTNTIAENIEKNKFGGYNIFAKNESDKLFICTKKVVFAFGGSAAPNFGTDGKSFKLAENLGHSVTKLYPVLVRLLTDKDSIKGLKGIKIDADIKLFDNNKLIKSDRGDILFNDVGISGNTIFYLSSFIPELLKPIIIADFFPDITIEKLTQFLIEKSNIFKKENSEELLNGIIHRQLGRTIIKKITNANLINDLTKNDIINIAKLIKNYPLNIIGNLGFKEAQVTRGGLSTDEFNNESFESKINKGVFACGEALDIDGDCGGYNLQWAFSSGMCVADYLISNE